MALLVLDWVLTVLHAALVLAFVLLWIPRRTSRAHGLLFVLVAFSWLVIGYFKGFGYCALTDLHWRVKHARGIHHLPGSFIKYAADTLTGQDFSPGMVNRVAGTTFVGVGLATGFRWSEGPVWFGDGRYVLWSDIPNNRIMRWDEETSLYSLYVNTQGAIGG